MQRPLGSEARNQQVFAHADSYQTGRNELGTEDISLSIRSLTAFLYIMDTLEEK